MSIAAGIVFATTTLVTFTWATVGRQLAAVPAVAKAVAYFDGGFRMPSEAYVDELMRVHETERAFGLVHEDDEMPGMRGMTYGEVIKMDATKPCVSEAAIDAAPRYQRELSCVTEVVGNPPGPAAFVFPADAPLTGWRGWLAGGYNMPTDHDIDAAPPHTLRGAFRGDIPRSHAFSDELPSVARLPNPTGLCG